MIMVLLVRRPILLLPMIDDITDNASLVRPSSCSTRIGFIHDRPLKVIKWLRKPFDLSIISFQKVEIIHPVYRHRSGICHVQAEKRSSDSIVE